MASNVARRPFAVIGENIHATRTVKRDGQHMRRDGEGREFVAFADVAGMLRTMPLAAPIVAGSELAAGKVKHIRNALLLGLGGDRAAPVAITGPVSPEDGRDGRDYLVAAARRQEAAGADYLDVNVDELAGDEAIRVEAIVVTLRTFLVLRMRRRRRIAVTTATRILGVARCLPIGIIGGID